MTHQNRVRPEGASPALRSSVDISAEVQLARRCASDWDGPTGELMANYAGWGDLLEAWNRGEFPGSAEEFDITCREHLDRSMVLGTACDREYEQQSAVWWARVGAGRWRAPGPNRGA